MIAIIFIVFMFIGKKEGEMPAVDIQVPDSSNRFGKVLVQVSRQITTEELSNLKLFTLANKNIRRSDFDKLKNPGDFLSWLLSRNYCSEKNTDFLEELLCDIGRKDLAKIIHKATELASSSLESDGPQTDGPQTDGPETDGPRADGDPSGESAGASLESIMSIDVTLERDEEPMQSSQNSISDDEKLQILKGNE